MKYIETQVSDLLTATHPQMLKYYKLRQKEHKKVLFTDVELEKKDIIIKYLVEPTYEGEEQPQEVSTNGQTFTNTTDYTTSVFFKTWWKFFTKESLSNAIIPLNDFKFMLEFAPVKVHCTCPAFHWIGSKYEVGKDDNSALYPTKIKDPIWSKRNLKNYGVKGVSEICKHLYQTLPKLEKDSKKILKQLNLRLQEWLDSGYRIDMRQGLIR